MDLRTRRINNAKRAGLMARLADEGVPADGAEVVLAAWEDEADRRSLARNGPGFWAGAHDWILVERRRTGR